MKGVLKWPLIIAAVFVVLRVALERAGAPEALNNIFSVVVLYVLICPLYFAFRIVKSGAVRPYVTLLKMTALYTSVARAMVIRKRSRFRSISPTGRGRTSAVARIRSEPIGRSQRFWTNSHSLRPTRCRA